MISSKVLLLLVVIDQVLSDENIALVQYSNPFHELVLCRNCGNEICKTNHIISKSSPMSRHSFYDKVFFNQDILVQKFLSGLFFEYPLITTTESTCKGVGEWEESSWFPGYESRLCVCPECGIYVGWVFRPIDLRLHSSEAFYGLILPYIIGESFADSLIIYPKTQN
ncbi:uncharacterized protein LOC114356641 [Ostrinia furnacalis]|uniref:uncharacterized protein LOC114356641 n=1 Tax=Ostrinia furnacalis TaxID=93504 RepID=UPI001038A49F|nr:uncharacterized protein LOC114356641 [Ostrinia furnacalis]